MPNREKETLTSASGTPVADNQNSLTAAPRGPILVADRYAHRDGNDDYTQAGNLFRLMRPGEKTADSKHCECYGRSGERDPRTTGLALL